MKSKIVFASLLLIAIVPLAQASLLSINDTTGGLVLQVDFPDRTTSSPLGAPFDPPAFPGGGTVIDANNAAANGITDFHYNAALETLSFTFNELIETHNNWSFDVYQGFYFFDDSGHRTDLLVLQGLAHTAAVNITFISEPGTLEAQDITTIVPRLANSTATPNAGDTYHEGGDWVMALNTGTDQVYVRSDVVAAPDGGATIILLGLSSTGMVAFRRFRK